MRQSIQNVAKRVYEEIRTSTCLEFFYEQGGVSINKYYNERQQKKWARKQVTKIKKQGQISGSD